MFPSNRSCSHSKLPLLSSALLGGVRNTLASANTRFWPMAAIVAAAAMGPLRSLDFAPKDPLSTPLLSRLRRPVTLDVDLYACILLIRRCQNWLTGAERPGANTIFWNAKVDQQRLNIVRAHLCKHLYRVGWHFRRIHMGAQGPKYIWTALV